MAPDLDTLLGNLGFIEEMYGRYRADPGSVDGSWRGLFELPTARGADETVMPLTGGVPPVAGEQPPPMPGLDRLAAVWALVNAYRSRGHLQAELDPLGMLPRKEHAELELVTYGFGELDEARTVPTGGFHGPPSASLGDLFARLRQTYCGSIGLEFMHLSSPGRKQWLAERMEGATARPADPGPKQAILAKLVAAASFERFLAVKYVGTKRFSLEGAETLIPLLELSLEHAARLGTEEVVLGMAHRGRLNVLTSILGKPTRDIFAEFGDIDPESALGSGDVKYHLGYSCDRQMAAGPLHLSLAFNPSHLEAVDPVAIGRVRAKQRRRGDVEHKRVLGILIHGDAAFAGQGLVPETLNLSELHGYRTGGTLHIIVNNQIGFTTAPQASRSTPYPTDVAKMIQCPIFHVNGEDLDAVARVVWMAMEYRATFAQDVVVDLFCYRKYGHNEADEPGFTQPLLYRVIEKKQPIYQLYAERLRAQGLLGEGAVEALVAGEHDRLEQELEASRALAKRPMVEALGGVWAGYMGGDDAAVPDVDTGVPVPRLREIAERLVALPPGFVPHPKIARLLALRAAMGRGEQPIDWGMAELLAFGSLLWDGVLVRLAGQDSVRGTFSHRHAAFVDYETGEDYHPLSHLHALSGECRMYDSPLSEAAALGFEFGYSLDYPDGLVIWEAQFGDFCNGAQVILDQFISSSEDKWKRLSGITLLLPHGFEGQGPEHSSARFERFLQLAAEDNMQIVQPTTPAQMFHLLRRQVLRKWRKPLVIMTPKSLLRHPHAVSSLEALAQGRFARVLADEGAPPFAEVQQILFCTGKIAVELAEERERRHARDTAILRMEQLYPWRGEEIAQLLADVPRTAEIVWVQEEPMNMGALSFIELRLRRLAGTRAFRVVARRESASPATGSARAHAIEQRALLDEAFGSGYGA